MISRRALMAAPALAALAGCAGPPAPAVVELTVSAARDINQDAAGTPRAVAVRVYGLVSRARFSGADAFALMDRERAVLADEGSRLEEIVVRPGEKRTVTLMPKPGVHYIGTVVLFQDIDRARWRAIAPIAAAGLTRLSLAIAGNGARLEAT